MRSSLLRVAGAILVLAFLGRASAFGIDTVNGGTGDVSGALGTVLTIDGSGFGGTTGTAKPKVFLDFDGKLYACKVTAFSDTQITAEIKKGQLGSHLLRVRPKGSTEDFTYLSVVLQAPLIDELLDESGLNLIDEASPGLPFTITGDFFGAKKPKIKIGGKKAKVLEWTMNQILLEMPKKLANGLWTIELLTKIGVDADEQITMIGSPLKLGKVGVTITLGSGAGAQTIKIPYSGGAGGAGLLIFGGSTTGDPIRQLQVTIPFDIDTGTAGAVINSAGNLAMLVSYNEIEKPFLQGKAASWIIAGGQAGATAYINAVSGGQVGGTVVAELPLLNNSTGHAVDDPLRFEASFIYEP